MGLIHGKQGNMQEAANLWYTAVMLDPRNADARYNLGVYYFSNHMVDSAEKYVCEAAELDERFVSGLHRFASFYYSKKDKFKLKHYITALQRHGQQTLPEHLAFINSN